MKRINWSKIRARISRWELSDYFRQFSIVAGGVIITFWGSSLITEHARQKEVRATMQLVVEELEHNRMELQEVKHLLDIDVYMGLLLKEQKMDVLRIPSDTIMKYGKFFNNMSSFNYRTDALDVLKGSSLMQYIVDKRLLQDVLQSYYELGRIQKDINDYYQIKKEVLMFVTLSEKKGAVLEDNRGFIDEVSDMLKYDKFVNYVIMTPGFLDWENFESLDRMLSKQIQFLSEKYK